MNNLNQLVLSRVLNLTWVFNKAMKKKIVNYLALICQVLEKLYRASWGQEDGVGCIIISPTRELAAQLFEELKNVGKKHSFSAGLLIGGCKDVDEQKDRVNGLNILVCTPGRLLQHMDETPNFDCSQLQVDILQYLICFIYAGF